MLNDPFAAATFDERAVTDSPPSGSNPWSAPSTVAGTPLVFGPPPPAGRPAQPPWSGGQIPWDAQPSWSPYAHPPRRRRTGWIVAGTATVVLVVVFALFAAFGLGLEIGEEEGIRIGRRQAGSAVPPAEVDRVVDELKRFVEREHQLEFDDDVDVHVLTDAAFAVEVDEGYESAGPDEQDVFRALGLIATNVDLNEASDQLDQDSIGGFYDPNDGSLVVRGTSMTPFLRGVIVHELTHALQDQNQNFDRDAETDASELTDVLGGLLEGAAGWTEQRYYDSLPAAERKQSDAEEERVFGDGTDGADNGLGALQRLFSFPYEVGPDFVDHLVKKGGPPAIVAAYDSPPATSEQLLHPEKYDSRERVKAPSRPDADGKVIGRGVVGEAGLYLLLAEHLDDKTAKAAAKGWGGDRYVAWRDNSRVCARVAITMDTAADEDQLRAAFANYSTARPGTSVSASTPNLVTMCEGR